MALAHTGSGEVVNVRTVTSAVAVERTVALAKTEYFELIRIVLLAGKEVPEHSVAGPIILQCLEGNVMMTVAGTHLEMNAGGLLHLDPGTPHALKAIEDSVVLLTIVFVP